MMEPSTPEGVEHVNPGPVLLPYRHVMEPSTPEGVEHAVSGHARIESRVMEPSTPEGVEHGQLTLNPLLKYAGDGTFDAGRR